MQRFRPLGRQELQRRCSRAVVCNFVIVALILCGFCWSLHLDDQHLHGGCTVEVNEDLVVAVVSTHTVWRLLHSQ